MYKVRLICIVIMGSLTCQCYVDEVLHPHVLHIYQTVGRNIQQNNASIPAIWKGTVCKLFMASPLDWPSGSRSISKISHPWDILGWLIHGRIPSTLPDFPNSNTIWLNNGNVFHEGVGYNSRLLLSTCTFLLAWVYKLHKPLLGLDKHNWLIISFCFGNAFWCCHSVVLLETVFSRRNALSSYQAVDAVDEAYLISYIHSLKCKLNHTKIQLIDQQHTLETIRLSFHSLVDWLQSLKHFFINVSYHILVGSLTLVATSI